MQEGGGVKTGHRETRPATVPEQATQAGEVRARWAWTEPAVWTERMLTALENGVKGGKWYSLKDKASAPETLRKAFIRVKANDGAAGVDHQTVTGYEQDLERNLKTLSEALREGTYRPQAIRRTWIPKAGSREKRPLGIPTVRDRIVQTALRSVLEPIFERDFAEHSYGFRPKRGCKDALRRVDALLHGGYVHVVDADLRRYFDTIPHGRLMKQVETKIADGRVLEWLRSFLEQKVMDTAEGWTPEEGTPQGAVISPLLSNLYLDPLDHEMSAAGYEMVRYADDFVILCRTESEAREALRRVQEWVKKAALTLHPDKTRIVDAGREGGFDFLGYHFERGRRWPSRKSLGKLKDAMRVKTKRTNGQSLTCLVSAVNRSLKGWYEYFKHSHRTPFREIDGWMRGRLRSILRKRRGGRGRGRGRDHQRWPNAFFEEAGLFSLVTARASYGQPARR